MRITDDRSWFEVVGVKGKRGTRCSKVCTFLVVLVLAIGNVVLSFAVSLSVLLVVPNNGNNHNANHKVANNKSVNRYTQQLRPSSAGSMEQNTSSSSSLIPQRFIFTYFQNILETKNPSLLYENIQHTMRMYNELWRRRHGNQGREDDVVHSTDDVWFLDDAACIQAIQEVEPRLVPFFETETRGEFKADMCRAAALFLRGGYYFDLDIEVIEPIVVPPSVNFVTAWIPTGNGLFQAFLFCQPRNEMVRLSMNFMLDFYEKRYHMRRPLLGPFTLKSALDRVQPRMIHSSDDDSVLDTKDEHSNNNNNNTALILYEALMDREGKMYPGVPRQDGEGPLCNYIVHDTKRPYFYSRKADSSTKCYHPMGQHGFNKKFRFQLGYKK